MKPRSDGSKVRTRKRLSIQIIAQLLLGFFLMISGSCIAWADPGEITPEKIKQIDAVIQERLHTTGAKGVSIALVQDRRIVFEKGYGVSDMAGTPVTTHTAFLLASVTKTFTALAILKLIEEKKLAPDRPVVNYLPDFRTRNQALSNQITVQHLLNQTSGLTAYSGNRFQNESDRPVDALKRNIRRLEQTRLSAAPGTQFEYSNANFHILGLLLERIDGKPIETIFQDRIWTPSGMKNSYALEPTNSATVASDRYRIWFNQAVLFRKELGRGIVPAGGTSSSSHDMGLYIIELLDADSSVITVATKAKILKNLPTTKPSYRNGWFSEEQGIRYLYHDGSLAGATSLIAIFPETKTGMVILSNTSIGMAFGNVRALEGAVLDIIQEHPIRPAQSPTLYRFIYAVVAMIFLSVVLISMRRAFGFVRPSHFAANRSDSSYIIGRIIIVSVGCTGFGIYLLFGAPRIFDTSLASLYEFLPDVSLMLGISGILFIWLGVSYMPSFRARKIIPKRHRFDRPSG